MKLGWPLGIVCALLLHAGILLFGGLLFRGDRKDKGTLQQVDLLSERDAEAEKKAEPKEPPAAQHELEAETEPAPDAAEIIAKLELAPAVDAPALEAASLSAIEQALDGQGGSKDFAGALSFASGGRIGGSGKAGVLDEKLENAFSLAELDQKPRPIFQTEPSYPAEMRGKKLEGVVSVIFVLDSSGKVTSPRAEKSNHPAFEKPALDAVRQWKFEPAIKGGQRVGCKMRVTIRFQPS